MGKPETQQLLFMPGMLVDFIPDDHILKRVNSVLDLSWLRDVVKECYTLDNGRPAIAPEKALRLMLAGLFQGIVHDRALMREAQVNLAIRWFGGYTLDDARPDHSSLTRIRQRWGAERFRQIFERTVQQCAKAGLISAETLHVDATLVRADVSWRSIVNQHVDQTLAENVDREEPPAEQRPPKPKSGRVKKRSVTDPDASMATSSAQYHLEPCFKQHAAVDDLNGVVVDVEVTTGEVNEGTRLVAQLDRVTETLGPAPKTVTADAGYAHGANYAVCEEREINAVIPPPRVARRKHQRLPAQAFSYDARHRRVRCPGGKILLPAKRSNNPNEQVYRAKVADCRNCPLRQRCIAPTASARTIVLPDGYEALLRARRRKARGWDEPTLTAYRRHRWRSEGVHGETKTQHGLRRAVRRGLDNVAIQAYLTAVIINLKRLVKPGAVICAVLARLQRHIAYFKALLGLRRKAIGLSSRLLTNNAT